MSYTTNNTSELESVVKINTLYHNIYCPAKYDRENLLMRSNLLRF